MSKKFLKTELSKIENNSFDEEKLTIDINYYTGAQVLRGGFFTEPYLLEFEQAPGAVILDRVKNGTAPFLLNHERSIETTLGKIIAADEKTAKVKFSSREEFAGIIKDIKDGILSSVSMGVTILEYEDITKKDAEMQSIKATKWELEEISLVAVPADGAATILEKFTKTDDKVCKKENTGENVKMEKEHDLKAKAEETKRVSEIMELAEKHALSAGFTKKAVTENMSVAEVKDRIIEKLAKESEETHVTNIQVLKDETDNANEGISKVLEVRMSGKGRYESGNRFNNLSLVEIAKEKLAKSGKSLAEIEMLSKDNIVRQALSNGTSDFKNILLDVSNKVLQDAYAEQPRTFQNWARRTSSSDFKNINSVSLGAAPKLQKVLENGEIKYGTMADNKETYKLDSYGLIVPFTRKAIINDDLGAFGRLTTELARAAARTESDIIYSLLSSNPALSDSVAVFANGHNNLTDAKLVNSSVGLDEVVQLLMNQTGLGGEPIDLDANFILCGPNTYFTAIRETASVAAAQTGNTNPHAGKYEIIKDSRVTGDVFYIGDLNNPVLEYAYLAGNEGPQFNSEIDFDTDGFKFKATHDFGAGFVDYRGMVKSTNDRA